MGQSDQVLRILHDVGLRFIPFLFALCFHEYAHGLVAKLRGDNTAELEGRLTMNPIAHMDFFGTFLLPILSIIFPSPIFFGWAKPVPVNVRNLKHPVKDMFWIALAGPLSNIFLAFVGAGVIYLLNHFGGGLSVQMILIKIFMLFIQTNLFLAVFNMIPLHPLDGGKVLARFLPRELNYKLEQNEHLSGIILIALIFTGVISFLAYPVFMLYTWLLLLAGVSL